MEFEEHCLKIIRYVLDGGEQNYTIMSEKLGIDRMVIRMYMEPKAFQKMTIEELLELREKNYPRYLNTIQNSEFRDGFYYRNKSRFDILNHVAEKYGYKVIYLGERKRKILIRRREFDDSQSNGTEFV